MEASPPPDAPRPSYIALYADATVTKRDVTHGESSSPLKGEGNPPETFEQVLKHVKSALGSSPLYLAASHTYRGDDRARIAALAAVAEKCATPLVATNDVLYHASHRRPLQDVLTCIREHTTINEAGLKLEANAERHLKRPAEMARLFKGHEVRARTHARHRQRLPLFAG